MHTTNYDRDGIKVLNTNFHIKYMDKHFVKAILEIASAVLPQVIEYLLLNSKKNPKYELRIQNYYYSEYDYSEFWINGQMVRTEYIPHKYLGFTTQS